MGPIGRIATLVFAAALAGCSPLGPAPQLNGDEGVLGQPVNTQVGPTVTLGQPVNAPPAPPQAFFTRKKEVGTAGCTKATAWLPLSRAGAVRTPQALATLIERSLKADPSGNGQISGTNMTPAMYLVALRAAGQTVEGVGALPMFLRGLVEKPMPTGVKIRMSRVKYSAGSDCVERFELDAKVGHARAAHPGENAWVDPNTGRIVMAQDCTNTALEEVIVQAAQPTGLVEAVPPVPTEQYCFWVRVKHPGTIYARWSTVNGPVFETWKGLKFEAGPGSGHFARLCLAEKYLKVAEKTEQPIVLCDASGHNTLRQADIDVLRAQAGSGAVLGKYDSAGLGNF